MTWLRSTPDLRALAFYLPQFHPIPENDAWWGAGFTEWTNVVRARSAFAGHHQPHLPAELGFYDLRCRETRHAQASLARAHGIHGFCYYHYWFNGTRLLERPMLDLLDDADLEFPFCVCWANENWTRRWDGREEEILIAQQYETYDPDAHIEWLGRAFADARYVRVNGRPLFLIYRASDLPDIAATIRAWRHASRRLGIGDLYVCAMANSQNELAAEALTALGFDAVVEFEPNLRGVPVSSMMPEAPGMRVYQYRAIAERAMAREASTTTVFPCVFPSWDNTARRGWRATCIQNDDAALYARWLDRACARASAFAPGERLVFINAWNEWAEGCHLEPDLQHGRMFLEATARVLGMDVPARDMAQAPGTTVSDVARHSVIDVSLDVNRPIYIWGSGAGGQRVADTLRAAAVPFRGFLDNDPNVWGKQVGGHPVIAPAEVLPALTATATPPFILIGSMAQDAISRDIEGAGGRVAEHYLLDGGDLNVHREYMPSPGYVRIGTWRPPVCPVCLSSAFTPTDAAGAGVCRRCQSSDDVRLAAVLFCDMFDWAHPPLVEAAPRRHVQVLHVGDSSEHLAALDALVNYERVSRLAGVAQRHVDILLLTHPGVDVVIDDCLAYAAECLRRGGQLILTARGAAPPWASTLGERAAAYGLVLGIIDRDWPRWGVSRACVWICRKP